MKLPTGWHEITIDSFLRYYTASQNKFEDIIDQEVAIIAALTGSPQSEVEKMTAGQLLEAVKKLDYLKKLPDSKYPIRFKCNGKEYKAVVTFNEMRADQFMNFSDMLKNTKPEDYIYKMGSLISCMVYEKKRGVFFEDGKVKFNKWEYYGPKDEFDKHLTMDVAYPIYLFFCKCLDKLPAAIRNYLEKEMKKLKNTKKPSRTSGRGSRLSMPLVTTTSQSGSK